MNMRKSLLPLLLAGMTMLAAGCADEEENNEFTWPANTGDAVATYVQIVNASYGDSVAAASTLNDKLKAFTAAPSQATLDDARQAWLDSREPYLQTEVYRFYDGPIDGENGPEGSINAWPLDENFIDYTVDAPNGGIVNGTEVIDASTLDGLNGKDGEDANVSTGYHAIEFLLWGQDLSDDGPGNRPFTDFVTDGTGTAANQDRRATYLEVVGDPLVKQLTDVHDAWVEGAAYRTSFVADEKTAFFNILKGMVVLSGFETGAERLGAAYDSGSQEDEHSCFSDNTHRDMIQDIQGVLNVWNGSYGSIQGTGIKDVVAAVDADLANRVDARIKTSLELANKMQQPFDQAIKPGNAAGRAGVEALMLSLKQQEKDMTEIFLLFGYGVEFIQANYDE